MDIAFDVISGSWCSEGRALRDSSPSGKDFQVEEVSAQGEWTVDRLGTISVSGSNFQASEGAGPVPSFCTDLFQAEEPCFLHMHPSSRFLFLGIHVLLDVEDADPCFCHMRTINFPILGG